MNRAAIISPCGRHRYLLLRQWGAGRACTFIMLNPSTADHREDDPTIRRCIGFAEREGCGRLAVINLFSLRSTDPGALGGAPYPNGPDAARLNALILREAHGPIICGWGADPAARAQAPLMLDLIRAAGHVALCLGKTKAGAPKHPLYLRRDAPLTPLTAEGEPTCPSN